MWSNDGMTLDVQWVEKNPHKTVNVHRGGGRANSGNYYTASDKWVVAHEVGHLLGLHDEYYDGSDPNRLMGEGDALMAYNFDGAKTYPRYHALIKEHFDSAASRPAAVADLPPEHQERWQAPPNPERVACPEGSSEYESVKEAYAEVFCKKDGEKTYLAYTRGSWWEWQEHLDDGSAILEHPTTGERLLVTAADLVPTAPTGTAIEQPDQTEPIRVEPPAKPKLVACPEGSSEYASVKDAYKDLFCQKDGEKTYLANIDGRWWTWDEHLDDGSVLLTNDAGEYRVFGAGDLTPTAPPGTVIEEKEPAVAEPEPEPEPEPEEPAVAEPEEELDDISWDPVVDVEEEPVEEPETATPDEDESVEEEPEEEVTETVWPRPRPGPPRWVREGRPPPPWLRNGDRPGTPRQAESGA
jgi:hypothetical protein